MSKFPTGFDTDIELPYVADNINEVGADAINALRDAVFALENALGLNLPGTLGTLSDRLGVSILPNGSINPSSLTSLGLITLPITNAEVSSVAAIDESKLNLTYTTSDLHNLILSLQNSIDLLNGFNAITGIKVEPHVSGSNYNHLMSHIKVDTSPQIKNKLGILRNNSSLLSLFVDLNTDYISHQKSDGTTVGTVPPNNFAHNASGIAVETGNLTFIPPTQNSVQKVIDFIDSSSLFLLGSRIQTLYSNGIPRSSRSSDLNNDGYGQLLVPTTPVITYLLSNNSNSPVDDINDGDDVIVFAPSPSDTIFPAQFSKVRSGDIIIVNYNTVSFRYVIENTKKILNGPNSIYAVRISGKNLYADGYADGYASASITRPLYTEEKYGVLASAIASNETTSYYDSLIIGNPRSASVLGIGFNPTQITSSNYNLYLVLYPDGNPTNKLVNLPPIDISGNAGATPGAYTLTSIVESTNLAFRKNGYNSRFIAFEYNGEFGIMLSDPYQNASFSIISGETDNSGNYILSTTFTNNVVDAFTLVDPLGFGPEKANLASPPFTVSYASPEKAQISTLIFTPLNKKFYYINGVEKERVSQTTPNNEQSTLIDDFGDGYWLGEIVEKIVLPNRVKITYRVNSDLATSKLKAGKTLVVQPNFSVTDSAYSSVDYGRFIIDNVTFNDCNCDGYEAYTNITLYDAIHNTGVSPYVSAVVGFKARLHFTDDSVAFDLGNISDGTPQLPYKRFFEVYVNGTSSQSGETFTHERARFLNTNADIFNFNFVEVSPKLRGYAYNNKQAITLRINNYDSVTGEFDGYLTKFDGSSYTHLGEKVSGKKGKVVRFYDESNVDYLDVVLNINSNINSFTNTNLTIELFKSIALDEELMLISTCQVNDADKSVSYLKDHRQFGNTSEKNFSTSALNYISAPQRLISDNSLLSGFEFISYSNGIINLKGGIALVNGKILNINESSSLIPVLQETLSPAFSTNLNTIKWYMCLNEKGDVEFIPSTDFATDNTTYTSLSLDHNRIFYVKNPNLTSPVAYPISGTYFAKVLDDKKLVPLYAINSTISLSSGKWSVSSANIVDLKRYSHNGYSGLNQLFIVGEKASFKTLTPAVNWLNELTAYYSYSISNINKLGNEIKIRDNVDISGITISFQAPVVISGDGGSCSITSAVNLTQNVSFKNLKIDVSSDIGFNINGNNIHFDNCSINYKYNSSLDGSFTSVNLSNPSKGCLKVNSTTLIPTIRNVKITNCNFTITNASHFPAITALLNAESSYLENFIVDKNIFTTSFSSEDKRSLVSVVTTLVANPTNIFGPKIVNNKISNNTFDKNQMIIISAQLSGSNLIANAPVSINSEISNNICGSIGYLVRQDSPLNTYNVSKILDKNNNLTIDKNTCKFIYNCFSNGFANVNSSSRTNNYWLTGNNLYSGSTKIIHNTLSWCHVGRKIPTSYAYEMPQLIIQNNKFNAFLASFLTDYYNSTTPLNIALISDKVVGN